MELKKQRLALERQAIARLGASMEKAPFSTCRWVGSLMGLAFYGAIKSRRATANSNLKLVFPNLSDQEVTRLARRSAQNFGMSFCEFLHLKSASKAEIAAYCQWNGLENILAALSGGQGVVLPTAHFGAWEVMGARAVHEFPLTVVVRLTSNVALREHIESVRRAINVQMIHKNEPARPSLDVLHRGEGLAIFPDQHAGKTGTLLPFFGFPTSVVTSPARLALVTGAPLVPTFAVRRKPWLSDGRVVITASPALKLEREKGKSREEIVIEGTQYVLRETEKIIRAHPDQWLWMHRRWRDEDFRKARESESHGK
ncbi:MAG TPA: lysophospholipid acyltransferase family protein [Abditibacterium sp.]|jgi:KDO2-lipid IV(A) lauroyltransferase